MVAGLGVRLSHADAARYSFLLGTPLIGAAAVLKVSQLFGFSPSTLLLVLVGMIVIGTTAFLNTRFLLKYFEAGHLSPFASYCWGAGLFSLLLFLTVRSWWGELVSAVLLRPKVLYCPFRIFAPCVPTKQILVRCLQCGDHH